MRAADNFKNLFEVPVLFYAHYGIVRGISHIPDWLVVGTWLFVALRVTHSFIHCTYNKVMHQFPVFMLGFGVVVALWVCFFFTLPSTASGFSMAIYGNQTNERV